MAALAAILAGVHELNGLRGGVLGAPNEQRAADACEVAGARLRLRHEHAYPRSPVRELRPEPLRRARVQHELLPADPLPKEGATLKVDHPPRE